MKEQLVHTPIKILIADSHFLVRQGLRSVFSDETEYRVVAESDHYDIIPLLDQYNPDVVIFGMNIQGYSARHVIEQVLRDYRSIKVLVLDTVEDAQEVIHCLEIGVHGYILKQCDHDEILEAVRSIIVGKNFFCSNVLKLNRSKKISGNSENLVQLSERELEILGLITEGLTNKEIADRTFISSHTVASHRKNLMKKFKAKNNVDLVISAIRDNFLTI